MPENSPLKETRLNETVLVDQHKAMDGKLVDFGGWNMPLHYGSQMEEHHKVRQSAGMFDVSHMTVVDVAGRQTKAYLQTLLANDVAKLSVEGKALYSAMLNERGGVIDDLIVYWLGGDSYRLIVNCATREKDLVWLDQQSESFDVDIRERNDVSMIAVQGPQARSIVDGVLDEFYGINADAQSALHDLEIFQGIALNIGLDDSGQNEWFVARTGYTGEDGYELIVPNEKAAEFWQKLFDGGVAPCGLGARDTLRLEAGMNLYGHEMDEQTSPLLANMAWTVSWTPESRDFIGRGALVSQKNEGIEYALVGLVLEDKGVLRAGQRVQQTDVLADVAENKSSEQVDPEAQSGMITSGSYSPTLGKSIALARLPKNYSGSCFVRIRNKLLSAKIVKPNFVRHGKSLV